MTPIRPDSRLPRSAFNVGPFVQRGPSTVASSVVLGASNHIFADVTWGRTLPNWTMSHVRMFECCGGIPGRVGSQADPGASPDMAPHRRRLGPPLTLRPTTPRPPRRSLCPPRHVTRQPSPGRPLARRRQRRRLRGRHPRQVLNSAHRRRLESAIGLTESVVSIVGIRNVVAGVRRNPPG